MNWKDKIVDVKKRWEDKSTYFEVRTSGSTGMPKVLRLEKSKMAASAKMSLEFFKLSKGDTALLALPADKIGGAMLIIRSIIGELNLLSIEPKLNPFVNHNFEMEIKFCSLTPAQLTSAMGNEESVEQVKKIKKILLGGSAVSQELRNLIAFQKNHYYHSYGMTETISHVAIRDLTAKEEYFKALDDVRFSCNSAGQLVITAPKLLSDSLLTNDLVDLIDEKRMIWRGRLDNVINSGGVKILIEELEGEIRRHHQFEFYLVGVADKVLGEAIVMVAKHQPPDLSFLHKHHRPKEIVIVKDFKYTENGKLLRLKPHQLLES